MIDIEDIPAGEYCVMSGIHLLRFSILVLKVRNRWRCTISSCNTAHNNLVNSKGKPHNGILIAIQNEGQKLRVITMWKSLTLSIDDICIYNTKSFFPKIPTSHVNLLRI